MDGRNVKKENDDLPAKKNHPGASRHPSKGGEFRYTSPSFGEEFRYPFPSFGGVPA